MFNKNSDQPTVPTFLGIGGQRCASTWLYHVLSEHKDIYMPPVKEIHYFDRLDREQYKSKEKPKGISLYKKSRRRYAKNLVRGLRLMITLDLASLLFYKKFLFEDRSDDWYVSLFQGNHLIAGEITPEYASMSLEMIDRVLSINPDLKIIYLLRHPVRRAWSQFQLESKQSQKESFSLEGFHRFLHAQRQLIHGKYLENIQKWKGKLVGNNFFVGFYDAIVFQPDRLLENLGSFLGTEKLYPDPTSYGATGVKMPVDCLQAGMGLYREPLQELSAHFGGYFEDWRDGILVSDRKRPTSIIF